MAPAYALGAPLDDWLAAAHDSDHTVAIPRLDAVLDPVARAVERARRHSTLREASAAGLADLTGSLGFDPLDRQALATTGIDLDGPLLYAGGDAPMVAVAVRDAQAVGAWLASTAGAAPATLESGPGWRWPEGVARIADGALFAARTEAGLKRLRAGRAGAADPVADCPAKRGAADLFVWVRREGERLCVTARFDPDRLRIDALWRAPQRPAGAWFAAGAGLPRLGAEASVVMGLYPGPAMSAALTAGLDPTRAPFVGPLALAVGPGALDILFSMSPADSTLLDRFVKAAAGRPDVVLDPPVGGLRRIAVKPVEGQPPPPVEAVWLGTAHGRAWIGTDRAAIDEGPTAAPRTALSPGFFEGAGFVLYLRPGGLPHDGGPWADAVAPRLTALGLDMSGIRQIAGGLSWVWAHLGELGLTARAEGDGWRLALEVVTL